jgi:hypothetical protein
MKTINHPFGKILLFIAFTGICGSGIYGQAKETTIKNSIEAKQFIFHAQTALPSSGPGRQLTSDYDLKVSKNSIVSYLPFFGRAYSLSYGSTGGGFDFTSRKFDYQLKNRKKGGWEISIKPTDVPDFREFSLILSENGYGTMQVFSNNRQPISFTGYITPLK